MSNDDNQPITKADLRQFERDLKNFILEREVVAMRWVLGIQISYFAITLAAVWFFMSHFKP